MPTVPEHGSSHSSETSEGPDMREHVLARAAKLKVVHKSRLSARESVFADRAFRALVILCGVAILAVVGLIVFELIRESHLSISKFGFQFLVKQIWDPVAEDFGALPFIYGTVVSSLVALCIAVPLSVGPA